MSSRYDLTPDEIAALRSRLVRGDDLPEWARHSPDCWLICAPRGGWVTDVNVNIRVGEQLIAPRRALAVAEGLITAAETGKTTVIRAGCNLGVWPAGMVYDLDQYPDKPPAYCRRAMCVNPHHADIRTAVQIAAARDGDPGTLYRVVVDGHRAMHHETLELARRCAHRYPAAEIQRSAVSWEPVR